jgi:hypothetical protein
VATPIEQLQKLRELRQFKERDLSLGSVIERERDRIARSDRKLSQLIELWRELVPEHLQAHATPTSVRAGTLMIEVDCTATAYEVDRMMRAGMEQELRSRFNGTLLRVKCAQKKR